MMACVLHFGLLFIPRSPKKCFCTIYIGFPVGAMIFSLLSLAHPSRHSVGSAFLCGLLWPSSSPTEVASPLLPTFVLLFCGFYATLSGRLWVPQDSALFISLTLASNTCLVHSNCLITAESTRFGEKPSSSRPERCPLSSYTTELWPPINKCMDSQCWCQGRPFLSKKN